MTRRRKTACISGRARQNGRGRDAASPAMTRHYGNSRSQQDEKRRWLVRVLARRAVEILTSQEQAP